MHSNMTTKPGLMSADYFEMLGGQIHPPIYLKGPGQMTVCQSPICCYSQCSIQCQISAIIHMHTTQCVSALNLVVRLILWIRLPFKVVFLVTVQSHIVDLQTIDLGLMDHSKMLLWTKFRSNKYFYWIFWSSVGYLSTKKIKPEMKWQTRIIFRKWKKLCWVVAVCKCKLPDQWV